MVLQMFDIQIYLTDIVQQRWGKHHKCNSIVWIEHSRECSILDISSKFLKKYFLAIDSDK